MVEGDPPPKPKRSLFSKPAFLATPESDTGLGDLFHRSEQSYASIRAEQAAKHKLKQQKKEASKAEAAVGQGNESKRRRISREDEGNGHADNKEKALEAVDLHASPSRRKPPVNIGPIVPVHTSPKPQIQHQVQSTTTARNNTKSPVLDIITLDEDDDDEIIIEKSVEKQALSEDADSDPDPDVRELKRSLRERKRLRELKAKAATIETESGSKSAGSSALPPASTISQPAFDPALEILITSRFPNARPLLVRRRWTQRLQEIREAYCNMNQLPKDSVFLTWRNRKLFDVTTCRSLGIKVNDDGLPVLRNTLDGLTEDGSKIHLEAVNNEHFAENKKLAEEKYKPKSFYEPSTESHDTVDEPPKEEKTQVRLILKAKDYDPWKAKVNLDHDFSRIAAAFRKQFKIADNKEVFLMYDGDRLDPQGLVREVEFEDQDTVEVHIR